MDIFANSKFGSHWQLLDQEARTKFQDILEEQNFAYRVVARHIHQLPSMPSIGHRDVIICLIRRFLDQTKGQATVEDAAVYLARSSWDVLLASHRWIDPENYAAMAEDELWGDEGNDEANLPHIHEVLTRVQCNSVGKETLDNQKYSTVDPLLSMFNHNYLPSAAPQYVGGSTETMVKAVRNIKRGEEIRISYADPNLPEDMRRGEISRRIGKPCDCLKCKTM